MDPEVSARFERIESILARLADANSAYQQRMSDHEQSMSAHQQRMFDHEQSMSAHQQRMSEIDEKVARLSDATSRSAAAQDKRLDRIVEALGKFWQVSTIQEKKLAQVIDSIATLQSVASAHDERLAEHDGKLDALADGLIRLEASQKKTDEQIGVLVRMMDDWIRRNPLP